MKYFAVALLVVTLTTTSLFSQEKKKTEGEDKKSILGTLVGNYSPNRDQLLGEIIKGILENYHLTHKKIDNDLSKKAFKMYIEKIDFGKQFLIDDDIDTLREFNQTFDDQLKKGDFKVVNKSNELLKIRIPYVQNVVEDILKKNENFNFDKVESYETDAEKREFADNLKELKERWSKLIKFEVIVQYLELKDEQNGVISDKDKKKNKKKLAKKVKTKKLSKKELIAKSRVKVLERYKKVFKRLLSESRNDRLDKFYNSITRIYDPHTHYFMPEEKEDFDIDMSGKLEGIGALLREEGSFIKVERIIPGSASWKGKELKAEDVILAVGQESGDFVDIVDMSIRDAVKLIRGKKGSIVRLKVKKPDGIKATISITRDQVILEESYVKSTVLEHKNLKKKYGYIHVPKFYRDFQNPYGRNCSDDVKKEIIKLKKLKVDGIILNLRNNGGGALRDAKLMSGLFIDKGPIVQVKNSGAADIKMDDDGVSYWDKPVIVLINRFSASASEIVAGALKDYKRAVIVGSSEQTHGKGTVQAILDMKDSVNAFVGQMLGPMGAMKITTDMFYRVNGMSTQFRGIRPDIELPDIYGYLDSGENSLDYAIPYDSIAPLKYNIWKKHKYNISKLKKNSEKRVAKSKKFKNIVDSVNYSKKRKDDTIRKIDLKSIIALRKEVKDKSDKFKNDDINKKMIVISTKSFKNEASKVRFDEFKEELQKDTVLEETLFIFEDILQDS
jgi:carboxyl-terminal processing protease